MEVNEITHDETKELMDDILQVRDLNRSPSLSLARNRVDRAYHLPLCGAQISAARSRKGHAVRSPVDRQVQEAYLGVE